MSTSNIIPPDALIDKRVRKLMGASYYTNPALRLILEHIEGIQSVDDIDGGRPVEWCDLNAERERKIAIAYFWHGVQQADQWYKEGIL